MSIRSDSERDISYIINRLTSINKVVIRLHEEADAMRIVIRDQAIELEMLRDTDLIKEINEL